MDLILNTLNDFFYSFVNFFINFYDKTIEPFWLLYVFTFFALFMSRGKKWQGLYWINIILGMFGASKTFNIFFKALKYKLKYNAFIIWNVPFYFVDLIYDSKLDLDDLYKLLLQYFKDTNNIEMLKSEKFRPIVIIGDEFHLYYFSRSAMKNFSDGGAMIPITQCRKRSILFDFITQELAQLDSTFRRLVPYVRKYYVWLFWFSFYRDYYLKKDDTDIKNEETAEIVGRGWFLRPWSRVWLIYKKYTKKYKQFFSEEWASKYIVALWSNTSTLDPRYINNYTYRIFINKLYWSEWLNFLLSPIIKVSLIKKIILKFKK